MALRQRVTGIAALVAAIALFAPLAWAQGMPELDRVLRKSDPAGELVADFNELVSATTNISPPSENQDQDRANVAAIRSILQDPASLALANDAGRRALAESSAAAQRIPDLAFRLDQSISTRLSGDARAGLVNDFKTVASYMAIVRPNDVWYCSFQGLRALLPC